MARGLLLGRAVDGAEDKKPLLLIVDDDLRILRALRLVLRSEYEILLAATLGEARDHLQSAKIDVTLCDQRMPDGLGSEFLSLLAREYPHMIRLLHSGSPPENIDRLIASGAVHAVIVKPAPVEDLRDTIESWRKRLT